MRERTIYECEHCNKIRYMNKYQMRDHEKICWYNPENRACKTCDHIDNQHIVHSCYIGIELENFPKPNINCQSWEQRED